MTKAGPSSVAKTLDDARDIISCSSLIEEVSCELEITWYESIVLHAIKFPLVAMKESDFSLATGNLPHPHPLRQFNCQARNHGWAAMSYGTVLYSDFLYEVRFRLLRSIVVVVVTNPRCDKF